MRALIFENLIICYFFSYCIYFSKGLLKDWRLKAIKHILSHELNKRSLIWFFLFKKWNNQICILIKTCSSHKSGSYIWYLYMRLLLHVFPGLIMFIELNLINFHSFAVRSQFYLLCLLKLWKNLHLLFLNMLNIGKICL